MPVYSMPYYFGLTEKRHKGHGTRNPQGASLFLEDCIAPIGLQARVLGYSHRPSVTETRLWLQASDLLLTLYHSFPLFPKIQILLLRNLDFCFVWGVTRTVQCNCPVDSCWSPAGRRPLHNSHSPGNENVTSLATRTKTASFQSENWRF